MARKGKVNESPIFSDLEKPFKTKELPKLSEAIIKIGEKKSDPAPNEQRREEPVRKLQ